MKLTKQRIFEIIKEEITANIGMSEVLLQEEPSLKNALAGVRRDYNQMVIKAGQPMSFVAKYKDEKKWYSGFDSLSPEEQDNYKQDIQTRLKSIEDSAESEPEASQDPEQQPEKPQELPSGDKVALDELPELQQAFKLFSDDDSGFMQVQYLRDQDKMIGDLRTALRKFLGIEGQERALKEQDESPSQTGDKNSDARKKLIKSVTRYRRDLNDAGKLLADYLDAAQAGQVKARLFLNKLKEEMQQIQNHNMLIVRDLLQIAGINENLVLEQESREEIIAKVESAYDAIVIGLKPALEIETRGEENVQQTAEEIQSIVGAAEDALNQVDSIKQYFRVTGTFNKPLGELKDDFLDYVAGYKKTMSDLVVDLKQGTPSPEEANRYAANFAKLADKIQEDFGVSPANPIKVPGLPVVQSAEDASDDNTAAINPAPSPKVTPEPEDDEEAQDVPEPTALLKAREDVSNFMQRSTNFRTSFLNPFVKTFTNPEKTDKDLRNSVDNFKKKFGDNIEEQQEPSSEMIKIVQDANKLEDTIKDYIRFVPFEEIATEKNKQDLLQVIQSYLMLVQKFSDITDQELQDLVQGSNKDIEKLNKIALQRAGSLIKNVNQQVPKLGLISKFKSSLGDWVYKVLGGEEMDVEPDFSRMAESKNLLEKLIKEELKVLNGKKMVRN